MARSRAQCHLYTDGGGWGLPTIDADGLSAHALFRFCELEYAATPAASRSLSADEQLPVAVFSGLDDAPAPLNSMSVSGLSAIVDILAANKSLPDPNSQLTPFQAAESAAFVALIRARLEPARLYELFVDDANYSDIYRTLMTPGTSWPVSLIAPFLRRRAVRAELGSADEEKLMQDAREVVASLSTRLGERHKYFYGDEPSVLDAIVFGQLAVALMVPLPRARLRQVVASYSNLVSFVDRIYGKYFKDSSERWGGPPDIVEAAQLAREEAKQRMREQSRRNAAEERKQSARSRAGQSSEDKQRQQGNQTFIWISIAVFAAHVLLTSELDLSPED